MGSLAGARAGARRRRPRGRPQAPLPALLPGWKVRVDGRVGRPLAEGMGIVAATPLPADGREVLAVSLFTNDAPTRTAQLQAAVRTTLERTGPRGA